MTLSPLAAGVRPWLAGMLARRTGDPELSGTEAWRLLAVRVLLAAAGAARAEFAAGFGLEPGQRDRAGEA